MAEITTHVFLAKDIKNKINCDESIKYFSLGPDVFFFSNKTRELGYIMHRNKSLLFFKNYIKYIKDNHLEKNKFVIGSLYGFLSHYVLDYTVHPYIFYYDHLNKNLHRKYEMCLTKEILTNHNIMPNRYKLSNDINNYNNNEVIKLLNYVFKETFGYDNFGNEYFKSIKRTLNTYRLFRYDRLGIKKCIYKFIDIFGRRKLSLISFYNIKEANMNKEHSQWNHPCDNKEVHIDSLLDLYNKSVITTIDIISSIDLVLNNKKDIDYLDKIIKNNSYVTGKNCEDKNRFVSFSSVNC